MRWVDPGGRAAGPFVRPEPRPLPNLDRNPRWLVWTILFTVIAFGLAVFAAPTAPGLFLAAGGASAVAALVCGVIWIGEHR